MAENILKTIKIGFDYISINIKAIGPFYYKFVLDGKDITILFS